jgi:hypothetical protein
VHAGQSPAKRLIRRKSDAIVGNLDHYLQAFDRRLDPQRTCVGVTQDVIGAFLDQTVDRLGKQAVEAVKMVR